MSDVFGSEYSGAYDILYKEKNYEAECDALERIFKTHSRLPVRKIIDFGCGTGNHILPLARRGYGVTGVERSEGMLKKARFKFEKAGLKANLVQGDLRETEVDGNFDAALMMFAVLGYQISNADVLASIATARAHLSPKGLFVFDIWYGPAVLTERPGDTVKRIPTAKGEIIRTASTILDISKHVADVHFVLTAIEGDKVVARADEHHLMRYFFPMELELMLRSEGFGGFTLGAFPDFEKPATDKTWNVFGIARAV